MHDEEATEQPARRWSDGLVEQGMLALHLVRWIVLGAACGGLAGLAGYVFLEGLDRVTSFRTDHIWLIWLLPVAGLVLGLFYHLLGGRAAQGSSLLIEQIHEPTEWVPRRMAPMVLLGTWLTHLVGGSAGREGTALQMSGSLTDALSRIIKLNDRDRRILLVASLGGGFGAVFGVPLAGAVFAMEVQAIGRIRYEGLVPALAASVVGDLVVSGLGYHHTARADLVVHLDAWLVARVALAGLVFGLVSTAFVEALHLVQRIVRLLRWPPLRPMIGGVALLGLIGLFGRDYIGLSLPLVDHALAGDHTGVGVFALKLLFTAVTLGSGFPGGEVTPLFVVGGTLGAALATPLHLPIVLLAAVGFVAVFGAAANVPLACTIMGVELFGSSAVVPFAVGCVVAYVFSNHRSIYGTQRIHVGKGGLAITGDPTLAAWMHRRRDH